MAERLCPECRKEMTKLGAGPKRPVKGTGDTFIVPLATFIYECSEHGKFEVEISGKAWPLKD